MKIRKWLVVNSRWLIIFIILSASVLRLYNLGINPPHLTADEASLGYNAYSILKTGRDEYGTILPIIFKSFGDFKPGLYVYATVPFVAVLGLNEFAVRLPSALAGIIAVWLLYEIIINGQWSMIKKNKLTINNQLLAITASFMLAISPWHIHFSRGAWEANLSLTLTLAGIYFFLRALTNSRQLIVSAIFFALTFIAYQGAKLSTTIVLLILVVTFWREVKKLMLARTVLASSMVVGLLIIFPVILSILQGQTGRLQVFSIFSYSRPEEQVNDFLAQGNEKFGNVTYYLYHSETFNYTRAIAGRWFNHFSGRFLFFEGDYRNPRHSVPNHGMMLLVDLILLPLGVIYLLKKKGKFSRFVLLWLVLAPLPSILSRDDVHAVRALNMVIPISLTAAFGLSELLKFAGGIMNKLMSYSAYGLILISYLLSLFYFLDSYFIHQPMHNARFWSYGYKQMVEIITPVQNNYERVKVQQSFAQPYIFFLFYQKYDPAKYQDKARLVESEYKGDVGYVEQIDNIYFTHINWGVDKSDKGTLLVADTIAVPPDESSDEKYFNLINEIKYPDGNTAFRILVII
jgi:4-amino-4-deoxy-L-arabinose transferase-like glycosyltransferase